MAKEEAKNPITEETIARINALWHKAKSADGLTPEEAAEQKALREAYVKAIRRSLRGTLNSIDLVDEDGTVTSLSEKHGSGGEN